jgi:hypothetical protein
VEKLCCGTVGDVPPGGAAFRLLDSTAAVVSEMAVLPAPGAAVVTATYSCPKGDGTGNDHKLPDDLTALVGTNRARDQSWVSDVAGCSDLPTFCQRTGGSWRLVEWQLASSSPHMT